MPWQTTDNPAAWPSERNARIAGKTLSNRFAGYRDELGLEPALDFHSYVTPLIEDGWVLRFAQEQVGHNHASTTSIYTCVSSDHRTNTLRTALDNILASAIKNVPGGSK